MGRLTLDPDLRNKLNGLNEPMEVFDEGGQIVGHFLPAKLYEETLFTLPSPRRALTQRRSSNADTARWVGVP